MVKWKKCHFELCTNIRRDFFNRQFLQNIKGSENLLRLDNIVIYLTFYFWKTRESTVLVNKHTYSTWRSIYIPHKRQPTLLRFKPKLRTFMWLYIYKAVISVCMALDPIFDWGTWKNQMNVLSLGLNL